MKKTLEFLYKMNNECEISDDFILEVYDEILNIEEREKSSIFISVLFTYIILKRKDTDFVKKLLDKSFEKDGFKPFGIEIPKKDRPIISISGSGKKGIKTINVSTTAAIIATSLGANIIKPCSASTSSLTGSFDLLELLGVNTELTIEDTQKMLDKTGFGLFAIEKLIPSFDRVYGGVFYSPNILSYGLAALMCPLKPDIVLYGLANKDIEMANDVLSKYGVNNSRIVSSSINESYYMDELNIFGNSKVLDSNGNTVEKYDFKDVLKLPDYATNDIAQMQSKEDNVQIIVDILSGKRDDAYVDLVCLNSGNILQLSGIAKTIEEGYYMSKEQVMSKQAINKLKEIVKESKGDIKKLEKFL